MNGLQKEPRERCQDGEEVDGRECDARDHEVGIPHEQGLAGRQQQSQASTKVVQQKAET